MTTCPKCESTLPKKVNFCPYCGLQLRHPSFKYLWLLAGLAGAFLGAGAILAYQLFKEKRLWDRQFPQPSKASETDDEDLMDF